MENRKETWKPWLKRRKLGRLDDVTVFKTHQEREFCNRQGLLEAIEGRCPHAAALLFKNMVCKISDCDTTKMKHL